MIQGIIRRLSSGDFIDNEKDYLLPPSGNDNHRRLGDDNHHHFGNDKDSLLPSSDSFDEEICSLCEYDVPSRHSTTKFLLANPSWRWDYPLLHESTRSSKEVRTYVLIFYCLVF